MLQPNSLMSVRKSSSPSSYLLPNLIQSQLSLPVAKKKNSISYIKNVGGNALKANDYNAKQKESGKSSKKVQQLAEEVANLLAEEQSIMTEMGKG